jgi:ferredoxin-NADP reductase
MATIMLTEPQTMPGTKYLRFAYASLIALLSVPGIHFGNFYLYPEQALVIGNIFTFITGHKGRHMLVLKSREKLSRDVYEFTFELPKNLRFRSGQYFEWTLQHPFTDRRGSRRFFTIASGSADEDIRIGIKLDKQPSSFKDALMKLKPGSVIAAGNLWGNFTLPRKDRKVAFIAGGIGITPYTSMIRYLLAVKQKRDIVLLYTNTSQEEVSYKDLFDKAEQELGIKVVYTLTGLKGISPNWKGRIGRIDREMIEKEIPDFAERLFYISGSKQLTDGVRRTLLDTGVTSGHIKTDYFPGYA